MKLRLKYSILPLMAWMAVSCSPQPYYGTENVVSQRYVHKYGVEVPEIDWTSRGENGVVISTHTNGVKVATSYVDGVQHGETSYTFPHREMIQRVETYSQGTLVKEVLNNSLGAPSKAIQYHSPTHLTVTTWYENGSPLSEEEIDKSVLVNGDYFNPQHQLEARVEDMQGTRIQRDAYGQLLSTDTIENGEMVLQVTYHPNNSPLAKTPYHKGMIQGQRFTYTPTGEPSTIEDWLRGKQHGITQVFQNGEKIAEIQYEQGMKEGIEKRFGENGMVAEEIQWHKDQRHGVSKTFVQNCIKTDWYFKDRQVSKSMYDQMSHARS